MIDHLRAQVGQPINEATVNARRLARYPELCADLPARLGIREWITQAQATGFILRVATNDGTGRAAHPDRLGLARYLGAVVTLQPGLARKPAPDLYPRALKALDADADRDRRLQPRHRGRPPRRAARDRLPHRRRLGTHGPVRRRPHHHLARRHDARVRDPSASTARSLIVSSAPIDAAVRGTALREADSSRVGRLATWSSSHFPSAQSSGRGLGVGSGCDGLLRPRLRGKWSGGRGPVVQLGTVDPLGVSHVIDVGVHYPVEDDPGRCVCGVEPEDRTAVMMHVLERGREALAAASPAELGALLELAVDRSRPLRTSDPGTRAAARALFRHGGFPDILRAALWLHWHPDGSLDPGLGMLNLTRRATVSRSDSDFLSVLRSMTSSPYPEAGSADNTVSLALVTSRIRARDRALLADAIDDWLLSDPPDDAGQTSTYRLASAPTAADISTGDSITLAGLAHTPWPERQEAARLLREWFSRDVEAPATLQQARDRATAIASPTTARPAAGLSAAVEMLAVTVFAIALDDYRSIERVPATDMRAWLATDDLPDLLDRALADSEAARWRTTVAEAGPGGQNLDTAREQAAALVLAEITAVEQLIRPGDAVLAKIYGSAPYGDIYWTGTVEDGPSWHPGAPQPSVLYTVRIREPAGPSHLEPVAFDRLLRDYDPNDTRGAGTRYNAVRCATADLRRAAYVAAESPTRALAHLGERFNRYRDQPDILTIMITVFVELLAIKNPRAAEATADSGEDLLAVLKPMIAKTGEPFSPDERARAVTRLAEGAGKAEGLLDAFL